MPHTKANGVNLFYELFGDSTNCVIASQKELALGYVYLVVPRPELAGAVGRR